MAMMIMGVNSRYLLMLLDLDHCTFFGYFEGNIERVRERAKGATLRRLHHPLLLKTQTKIG